MEGRRVPDHLGLALGALVAALVTPLLIGTVLGAAGGGFWLSFGAPICAALAVSRALRARTASGQAGFDTRHRLGEGARSLAVVSLLYSVGVLALNGLTAVLAVRSP